MVIFVSHATLLMVYHHPEHDKDASKGFYAQIIDCTEKSSGFPCIVGVGRRYTSLSDAGSSYTEAVSALLEAIHEPQHKLFFYNGTEHFSSEALYLKTFNSLIQAIEEHNEEKARQIPVDFLENMLEAKFPPIVSFQLYQEIYHKYRKHYASEAVLFNQHHSLLFPHITAIKQIDQRFESIIGFILKIVKTTGTSPYSFTVRRIIHHIHSNYRNDLALTKVCSKFNINVSYFCKIFKSETGVTFSK